jgi:hypothetical protein
VEDAPPAEVNDAVDDVAGEADDRAAAELEEPAG